MLGFCFRATKNDDYVAPILLGASLHVIEGVITDSLVFPVMFET